MFPFDGVAPRPLARALLLGLCCLLLQQVAIPYQFSLMGVEEKAASLVHLHVGGLLLIAMLERDRRVVAGVAFVVWLGWATRVLSQGHDWLETVLIGTLTASLGLGWLLLCARWMGWPRARDNQRVELADLPRFALFGLVIYPIGLIVVSMLLLFLGLTFLEQLNGSLQSLFAKHFGTLALTLPGLCAWCAWHEPAHGSRRIGWVVPLLLAVGVVISIVAMQKTRLAFSEGGSGAVVLMDYRFGLFAVLAWCMLRLRPRYSMALLAATLLMLIAGISGSAAKLGQPVGFLNLFYLAIELSILLMAMLYVQLISRDWWELTARLEAETRRDPMTGLPNLKALRERLHHTPAADREHELGYLLLDHTDELVPGYGLQMQASVMNEVAGRLHGVVQPYLVSTGQFALLPPVQNQDADFWPSLVGRIEQSEIGVDGERFRLMPYMGVTRYTGSAAVVVDDALLAASQLAFEARGRNEMTPLYESHQPIGSKRLQRQQFDDAGFALDCLRSGRIELYLQPIRSLNAAIHAAQAPGALVGEVLCRLRDQRGNQIMPARFLKPLEAMGRGAELDLAVLRLLFRELRAHPEAAARCVRLSINITGQSLASVGFEMNLRQLLEQSPVPLSALCFEITETAAIASPFPARAFLDELRSKGCLIAIDDFGTGMQSFSRLKEMPVDIIKIDGSFVLNVAERGRDYALVEACVAVARAFHAETVAEFVETEETADILRDLGVGWMQGYLYSKPRPFVELLRSDAV